MSEYIVTFTQLLHTATNKLATVYVISNPTELARSLGILSHCNNIGIDISKTGININANIADTAIADVKYTDACL